MKTIHLNLAARPFRDYRPVYAVALLMSILTAFLMMNNIETAHDYFANTREIRAEIVKIDAERTREEERTRELEATLKAVNWRALNVQTKYINTQIEERAFSWSQLLAQLEAVLPNDVRLTSLNPSADKNGLIHLQIDCVSKTHDGMIDMINRLLADPHFDRPFPEAETQQDGLQLFVLGADYHPNPRGVTR